MHVKRLCKLQHTMLNDQCCNGIGGEAGSEWGALGMFLEGSWMYTLKNGVIFSIKFV